jgi:hypothetical protein
MKRKTNIIFMEEKGFTFEVKKPPKSNTRKIREEIE